MANGWTNATVSLLSYAIHLVFIEKLTPPPLVGGGGGRGLGRGGSPYDFDDRISAAHGRQNDLVKAF